MPFNKIVIIGATSSIAEHCARLWVKESPKELILVGRNAVKTEQVAMDLRVRSPQSQITVQTVDFFEPTLIREFADRTVDKGMPDLVFIAHGSLPDQAICQQDLAQCKEALLINAISPVLFAEAFAGPMQRANHGTLAIIGSVAGDRGRKSNYVYGAGKGLVARYAQGLQHRLAHTKVKVVLIKPGPTDTPMTALLKENGNKLASVEDVAHIIIRGVSQKLPLIYAPRIWRVIMMIISHLPNFIFKKINI